MSWRRLVVLCVCLACLSCGSDGGPVGTGISSTSAISGNIVDVQAGSAAAPPAAAVRRPSAVALGPPPLPRIQVSLDGLPGLLTTVDSGGNFTLTGHFAGPVTLRFTVPQFQVTQPLDVPAGSTVVLQDIELQPDGVVAQAARQLAFFGTVDLVDCADGMLLMHERRSAGTQFLVRLDDQTSFFAANGRPRTCADIRIGNTLDVEGAIAYATDRTITALAVTIAPPPPPPPLPQLTARFSGAIAALDCATGFVVVDDATQRTRLQLTAATRISAASGSLTCHDLTLGDRVRGDGQLNRRMAGLIVAQQLIVTGPPNAQQPLRFVGFVDAVDCGTGYLQIGDVSNTLALHLSAATVITGGGHRLLMCSDLQPGDRVTGLGEIAVQNPGTLDALQITVKHVRFD